MKIKDYFKIFQKITAIMILSAMFGIAGCGAAESDVGQVEAAKDTTEVSAAETVNDSANVSEVKDVVSDLPPQAYKTTEERQAQHVLDEDLKPMYSNQFLMIEEVINEPEEGWGTALVDNGRYIKLKGTLYEVYFYDEPATDLVYFPGDELPEGYEVKVTEDYEVVVADDDRLGTGHDNIIGFFFLTTEENGEIVYGDNNTGCVQKADLPDDITSMSVSEAVAKYGNYLDEILVKPGMYVILYPPSPYDAALSVSIYGVNQCLTKEDLEKLPAGTTIAHGVAHY